MTKEGPILLLPTKIIYIFPICVASACAVAKEPDALWGLAPVHPAEPKKDQTTTHEPRAEEFPTNLLPKKHPGTQEARDYSCTGSRGNQKIAQLQREGPLERPLV